MFQRVKTGIHLPRALEEVLEHFAEEESCQSVGEEEGAQREAESGGGELVGVRHLN